jgi:hypothetical protein
VEKKNKDVILAILTRGQNQLVRDMIKRFNIENAVLIKPTKRFNDQFRLSYLRAASILVLPVSKTPGEYLAEMTTMYQFMAAGNVIVTEYSPRRRGRTKRWTHSSCCQIRRCPQFSQEDRAPHRPQRCGGGVGQKRP